MGLKLEILYTGPKTYAEEKERQILLGTNFDTGAVFANNGTAEIVSGNNFPKTVEGPSETMAGEKATYTITDFVGKNNGDINEKRLPMDKCLMKWALYIDGVPVKDKNVEYLSICNKDRAKEASEDFMAITDIEERTKAIMEHAILYATIESAEADTAPLNTTKLTVEFSKWLDGHKVHIEAYRSGPDMEPSKDYVVTTNISAQPEIVKGYWANHRREEITNKTVGYKDTVYMCLETLGMKGKTVTTELWEEGITFMGSTSRNDETICMNENIAWKLEERRSYKKLELPDQDTEEYKKQREGIWETDPLELYFKVPSEKDIDGYKTKFGQLLYLTTDERISDAYFAKQVKQKAIHDGTVKEEEKPRLHIVQPNETLSRIAPKYGIHWQKDLAKANDMKAPWTVTIGQILKLPDNAVIPKDKNAPKEEPRPKPKEETVYERTDSASLGGEVHLVVETANLHGKKVNIEVFDNEKLLAKDTKTPIKLLKDDNEVTKLENITINDTGKAIAKVKLRPKSDEDYKKLKEKFKDDKVAKLFLKVTCQGDDKNHEKEFLTSGELEVKKSKRAPWMEIAYGELGVEEIAGKEHNDTILTYHESAGFDKKSVTDDKSWPWCASFASWVFKEAGYIPVNGSGKATNWKSWGKEKYNKKENKNQ